MRRAVCQRLLSFLYCRLAPEDVLYFDDTVGLLVFGGSEQNPSFQGYIGQAVLYRHKAITAHQVSFYAIYTHTHT